MDSRSRLSLTSMENFHSPQLNRKQWTDSKPFTPPSQVSPSSKKPTLRLIYFAEKPVVEFGKIQVGEEKTRELLVVNPENYDRNVVIEGVPERKGFTVFCAFRYPPSYCKVSHRRRSRRDCLR